MLNVPMEVPWGEILHKDFYLCSTIAIRHKATAGPLLLIRVKSNAGFQLQEGKVMTEFLPLTLEHVAFLPL